MGGTMGAPRPHDLVTYRRRAMALLGAVPLVVAAVMAMQDADTARAATGRTFYVSASGNDAADGRSSATAWRSIGRVNSAVLAPGDRLLLQGGRTFTGMLYLDQSDAGDATAPVVIGSYGSGRATITGSGNSGIFVYNTAGVEIRDLVVVGDSKAYRSKGGISFYGDRPARALAGITVTGVDVSGFRNGVEIGSATAPGGFRTVRVSASLLHDNMEAGLATYGPAFQAQAPAYAHEGVTVDGVRAYRNVGDPSNTVRNTGSGIILGSVRGGHVTGSSAYENGSACTAPEGPVGIWTYDSTRVVIEKSLSYRNRTGGSADGGGFDLDQNVSNSVLQYNLSYDNDAYGYLVYTARSNSAHRNNVVRFNVSQNDVRKNDWYGGITVVGHGSVRGAHVYHNTVVSSVRGAVRPAPLKLGGSLTGVTVRNNVFVSVGTGRVVTAPKALARAAVVLQGNAYQAVGTWGLRWGKNYVSLGAWRRATGQEYVGGTVTGFSGGAGLVNPYTSVAVTDPALLTSASGFRLRTTSPLIGRGLDLRSRFGTKPGPRDFYRTVLSAASTVSDVGAHQLRR